MEVGPLSVRILRELCENSRINLTEMMRRVNAPTYVVSRHIQRLEEELGLKYTLEIDHTKLGLAKTNVLYFKFSKKVGVKTIKTIVENSNMVQLALITRGKDFDLVLFITPRSTEDYAKWELALLLRFSEYGVAVTRSYADIIHLGFIPLNDWAIQSSSIKKVYKQIILELNQDSRQTIRALSEKLGMNEDMVRYYLLKMQKEGIIKKFTTVVTKPNYSVNVILFANYTFRKGFVDRTFQKRRKVYFKEVSPLPLYNEYQMVGTLSGAEDDLVWGIYGTEKEALENCVRVHKSIFAVDSPSIKFGYVQDVVKGIMPIRNIETKNNYVATAWIEE